METQGTAVQGVYQVTHKKTGQIYIGSSKDCNLRFYQHHRAFMRGNNNPSLQRISDTHGNLWKYEIVERVAETKDLEARERHHITELKKKNKPLLLNRRVSGSAPMRNMKRAVRDANRKARCMIGKNLKYPEYKREVVVSFVSPDGKLYPNVRSVKRFAKQHGLTQSALNMVAQGRVLHHHGWTLPNTPREALSIRGKVHNLVVVSPDGTEYKVNNLYGFCMDRGLNYNSLLRQLHEPNHLSRPRKNENADEFGRAWHIKGKVPLYTITDIKTGEVYRNIAVPPVFSKRFNLSRDAFRRCVKGQAKKCGKRFIIQAQEESQ